MQVAVLTKDKSRADLLLGKNPEEISLSYYEDVAQLNQPADIFIDLDFEQNGNRVRMKTIAGKYSTSLFLINSVCENLHDMPAGFVRFNGWNTFLERSLVEASSADHSAKKKTEEFFAVFNKTLEWTPDVPGFLSARVISMIINEAYFTLQDNVSTREDIDTAMKLGTNYPYGPFEWGGKIGLKNIVQLLETLASSNPRYKPAALLSTEANSL